MPVLDYGFKNVRQNGQITGFQVQVVNGYYRGIYVPIVRGFEVEVDGESFKGPQIKCGFNGKTYEQTELNKLSDVRWQWLEPATLTVSKPGGLKPGWHNVTVATTTYISYMPSQPGTRRDTARLALVR